MSDASEQNGDAMADTFTRMWSDFTSRMTSAGIPFSAGSPPPEMARQMRDVMLAAMAKSCEEFMRSPVFLESMKQTLDGAVAFRRQLNEFLTKTHHEMQGVAREDVDSLLSALRSMDRRLNDRLDDLDGRLEAMEARGAAAAKRASAGTGKVTAKSKKKSNAPGGKRKAGSSTHLSKSKRTRR